MTIQDWLGENNSLGIDIWEKNIVVVMKVLTNG